MEDFDLESAVKVSGLSRDQILALQSVFADREAEEVLEALALTEGFEPLGAGDAELAGRLAGRVSDAAMVLMVELETGGRPYYERVYEGRPVWPEGSSGITLGVGYDLAYVTEAEFRQDWRALGSAVLDRFVAAGCIGTRPPRKSADGMRAIRRSVRDIRISWDMANAVFRAALLPKFALQAHNALPNCDKLHGDCFGALVALTFNRGPSYNSEGPRYQEMRDIKAAMQARDFARIPPLIREMVRIWEGTSIEAQMERARNAEARLFDLGLAAMAAAPTAGTPGEAAVPTEVEIASQSHDDQVWTDLTEEQAAAADVAAAADGIDGAIIIETAERDAVIWAADAQSPDYSHLASSLPVGMLFSLTADDLELLCRVNDFPIADDDNTPFLFGLRGTGIVSGGSDEDGAWRTEATLKDIRPNHRVASCVLGVWHRGEKRIAVFQGSTVPNENAVIRYRNRRDAGNILATGFYRYIVGTHNGRPGCFLLRERADVYRRVVVRRSVNDLTYELTDIADTCEPGDNIHPAFSMRENYFSSLGCQVIIGMADNSGAHSGPWSRFRRLAGLTTGSGEPGKPYRYVLLTGREALLAADLRKRELAHDAQALRGLRRLRFGSFGPAVGALQAKLGVAAPDNDFGPGTAGRLHGLQSGRDGNRSDGIYSPRLDEALGWSVFSALGV